MLWPSRNNELRGKMQLSELKGNPGNPRTISDDQLKMLKKSLLEFGDLSGIIVNKKSGHVLGGHQRLKVLPDNSQIVIENTFENPTKTGTIATGHVLIDGERFQYREVYVDDTREKAMNIAANKHGGQWDLRKGNEK